MPNIIKPKRSYTATNTPTLASGELGINAADGKIYLGNATGTAQIVVSSLARSDHTGTLSVASGGTGATTLTANNVILGNGTSTPSFVAPGTAGNLLTSNGTTWASTAPTAASGTPTGALMPYAGATAPTGYLLCDGAAVSRTTYAALFAVTGTTYGAGDGSSTFNLPDCRGRMAIGVGTGTGLTARVRGTAYGSESHTVSSSNIQQFSTGNAGGHSHTPAGSIGNAGISTMNLSVAGGSQWGFTSTATITNTVSDHSHTVGTASPTSINHTPPVLGFNYIIKT